MSEARVTSFKPVILRVIARKVDNDELVSEHICNFNKVERKKWLHSFIVWATLNKMTIEILNIDDDKE